MGVLLREKEQAMPEGQELLHPVAGNVFVHIKNNIPIPFLGDFGMSDTFGDAIRHAADGETNLWWVTNFSSDTNKVIIQTMIIMGVFF